MGASMLQGQESHQKKAFLHILLPFFEHFVKGVSTEMQLMWVSKNTLTFIHQKDKTMSLHMILQRQAGPEINFNINSDAYFQLWNRAEITPTLEEASLWPHTGSQYSLEGQ